MFVIAFGNIFDIFEASLCLEVIFTFSQLSGLQSAITPSGSDCSDILNESDSLISSSSSSNLSSPNSSLVNLCLAESLDGRESFEENCDSSLSDVEMSVADDRCDRFSHNDDPPTSGEEDDGMCHIYKFTLLLTLLYTVIMCCVPMYAINDYYVLHTNPAAFHVHIYLFSITIKGISHTEKR